MKKSLSAIAVAAALFLAAPHSVSALPGPGTAVKTTSDVTEAGYKHHRRWYKHRHWKRGHHHHRHRYYRKRKGIYIHVH